MLHPETKKEIREIREEIKKTERQLREAKKILRAIETEESSPRVGFLIAQTRLSSAGMDAGVAMRMAENAKDKHVHIPQI